MGNYNTHVYYSLTTLRLNQMNWWWKWRLVAAQQFYVFLVIKTVSGAASTRTFDMFYSTISVPKSIKCSRRLPARMLMFPLIKHVGTSVDGFWSRWDDVCSVWRNKPDVLGSSAAKELISERLKRISQNVLNVPLTFSLRQLKQCRSVLKQYDWFTSAPLQFNKTKNKPAHWNLSEGKL